jgi:16S rRNA (guanine1207-N2)-methyltransferase
VSRQRAPELRLLGRVLPELPGRSVLVLDPPQAGAAELAVGGREADRVLVQHRTAGAWLDDADREQPAGARVAFGLDLPEGTAPFELAAVVMPKGGSALHEVLITAANALVAGGRLVLVGTKRAGVKSAGGRVEELLGPVLDRRAGAHCQALLARRERSPEPREDERRIEVVALGRRFAFTTLPGVFAHGRLDDGTAFLLEHLAPGDFSRALDWGCGGGVLGAALALARPEAEVLLADSSAAAIEAARRTLRSLGRDAADVLAADGWRGIDGDFDLIVTNPPFHQGVATDRRATERFLDAAHERLRPGGRLVLVANAFLPWAARLAAAFDRVDTAARSARWQVVVARR